MNNKGFTLIEMIMVIIILAMLALITSPNIIALINKNKVDDYNGVITSIVEATKLYVYDNKYKLEYNANCGNDVDVINASVSLKELVDLSYLTSPIKNECTKEELEGLEDIKVTVTLDCDTKQFSYLVDEEKIEFKRIDGVTNDDGIIIDDKFCSDLY